MQPAAPFSPMKVLFVAGALALGLLAAPVPGNAEAFDGGGIVVVRDHGRHGGYYDHGRRGVFRGGYDSGFQQHWRYGRGGGFVSGGPRHHDDDRFYRDRRYYGDRRHYDRRYYGRYDRYRGGGVVIRLR